MAPARWGRTKTSKEAVAETNSESHDFSSTEVMEAMG
jgi:hypothetical protein